MVVMHIIIFLLGLFIVLSTLFSAVKQTVLSGRKKVRLSRAYDFALIALANFVCAPKASWSSDRKLGLTARDLVK